MSNELLDAAVRKGLRDAKDARNDEAADDVNDSGSGQEFVYIGGSCRHSRNKAGQSKPCHYCTLTDMEVSQDWLKTLEALRQATTVSACLKDVRNGGKFQLAGFMISIGRSANNQVVLKDDAVSRAHALITCEDDKYFISDLGSTNGTLLNGSPLRSRQRLTDGDVIRLGNTILWFAVQQNCALSIEHAYISL